MRPPGEGKHELLVAFQKDPHHLHFRSSPVPVLQMYHSRPTPNTRESPPATGSGGGGLAITCSVKDQPPPQLVCAARAEVSPTEAPVRRSRAASRAIAPHRFLRSPEGGGSSALGSHPRGAASLRGMPPCLGFSRRPGREYDKLRPQESRATTKRLHDQMPDQSGGEWDLETIDMLVNAAAGVPEMREVMGEEIERLAVLFREPATRSD